MPYSILDTQNSPNFNVYGWGQSQRALAKANAPKVQAVNVASTVDRLKATRFDAKVEEVKVVNRETTELPERRRAELLGYTVKTLRAQCKAEGHKGYSKLKKSTLVDLLLA